MERTLRLVVVTPEKTLLDERVDELRLPLYDGSIGILPGRAPLLGRLGHGELRLRSAQGERSYFVDGGFVQVKGAVVSVLTNRAIPAENLEVRKAEQALEQAAAQPARTPEEIEQKLTQQDRARRVLALARKPR